MLVSVTAAIAAAKRFAESGRHRSYAESVRFLRGSLKDSRCTMRFSLDSSLLRSEANPMLFRIVKKSFRLMACVLVLCGGCDEKATNGVHDATQSAASSARDAVSEISTKASEAYATARDVAVQSFGPRVQDAQDTLAALKAKAATVSAEQRPAIDAAVVKLESQLKEVGGLLGQLKTAGADKWQELSAKLGDLMKRFAGDLSELKGKLGG